VDRVSDPLLLRRSSSTGNRTLNPGSAARNSTRPQRRSFLSSRQLKLYNQTTGLLKNHRLILRVFNDVISTVEVMKRYIVE
jgi:hypothetical protein